jgi:hypothetical protein
MKQLLVLAAGLVLAATAPAMAGNFYHQSPFQQMGLQPAAKSSASGGIVESNGKIAYGSGFSVSHPATGEYEISYTGGFKKCPVISVLPAGTQSSEPIANLYGYNCASGGVQFTVLIFGSTTGSPEDSAFHFIAIEP